MIPAHLTIRHRELPQPTAAAWLVPGNDVSLRIEEWLRWNLPQANWKLAILPGWGVLTILAAGHPHYHTPRYAFLFAFGLADWYAKPSRPSHSSPEDFDVPPCVVLLVSQ